MTIENRSRRGAAAGAGVSLALAALVLGGPGCGPDAGHNRDASPIVRPDSEPGKKAIAETESLLRLRKEQEARARMRRRTLPQEG